MVRLSHRIQALTDQTILDEYFMTTNQLNSWQARCAEALSEYYFTIMYRPGKPNTKADTLTRGDDEVAQQDGVEAEYRTRAFLSKYQVDILNSLSTRPHYT